ncbi:MAG: MoxR family ATPase [Candidatus Omnitrophota bacterium]|nr:MoxR family ATPase [Candidatus Omnitrophota bacterium]
MNGPTKIGNRGNAGPIPFVPPRPEKDINVEEFSARIKQSYSALVREIHKVIVGQDDVIDLVIIGMLCRGHVLLEGIPGLGKTLMFRTLAKLMNLQFQHVQFTPDLMPSDIIGTEIIQQIEGSQQRSLKFIKGPIFCHLLLADEINRTSPKSQSALLQAMQDREVSVGNYTHTLEEPFFVLATQNPIDQEGVYPLPEAQLDRFMFNVFIDYPSYEEEVEITERFTQNMVEEVSTVLAQEDIINLQGMVRSMIISDSMMRYAVDIVTATRPGKKNPHAFINEWVEWGAGPRASLCLTLAAKARALLKGRLCVSYEDIRAVAPPVLRHRIKLNFAADAENRKPLEIIDQLLRAIPERKERSKR